VTAAAALFAFFFGGCSSPKGSAPSSSKHDSQGNGTGDRYVEPRTDPMEKYHGSFGPGHRW
jgi:hypothetical protein